jgi:hypothetical protein
VPSSRAVGLIVGVWRLPCFRCAPRTVRAGVSASSAIGAVGDRLQCLAPGKSKGPLGEPYGPCGLPLRDRGGLHPAINPDGLLRGLQPDAFAERVLGIGAGLSRLSDGCSRRPSNTLARVSFALLAPRYWGFRPVMSFDLLPFGFPGLSGPGAGLPQTEQRTTAYRQTCCGPLQGLGGCSHTRR